jgi:hypothetical protein
MPIDASIPLGYKPVQTPNMLAAAAQGQELGINALKMSSLAQEAEDRNFMRGLDSTDPQYINKIAQRNPKLALELQKGRTEARTAELDQRTKIGSLLKTSATPVIANPTFENAVMALQTFSKATGENVTSEFNNLQKIGNNPEAIKKWAMGHALSGDQILAQTDLNANQKAQLGQSERHFQVGQQGAGQTLTDSAGNVTVLDKQGNVMRQLGNIGKPSATFEKTAALQKQQGTDLGLAITELENATKDKGLIDQSTGSGIGRLVDVSAGAFGSATPGAIAIAKLKPIADMALKMVPRFEGPQSDKDTQSYKEAAGQLADASLPTDLRKAAGKEVLRLMKARKNQFVNEAMANEGIGAGAGVDTSNPLLK